MKEVIAVFLGGGAGSLLRYLVQMALHERIHPYSFPWATLAVNLAGSFLIGLFYAWSARFNLSPEVRLLLTTGLCGGFTTFSTFSNDCLQMVRQGYYAPFVLYACLSVGAGHCRRVGRKQCGEVRLIVPGQHRRWQAPRPHPPTGARDFCHFA